MASIDGLRLKFSVSTPYEKARAATWQTKEPGTIAWLSRLTPGDVFWDVGANVGVYSLVAAKLGCRVFAFEPHTPSCAALIRNVLLNGVADRIQVVSMALSERTGAAPFNHLHAEPGSSGSQLGHRRTEFTGRDFAPALVELKWAVRGDELPLPPPDFVKVDVDGNEAEVLTGMEKLQPRSIQVETHPGSDAAVCSLLVARGYELDHFHLTAMGREYVDNGGDQNKVAKNVIYRRKQ